MNDLSFINFLAQSYNSSPDWIKFVLIIGVTSFIVSLIWIPFYYVTRWRELSFRMKEKTILGKAALDERKDLLRVVYHQQELLAVPDVDAELYNLPDCPIPVVKSLHSMSGEWPEEVREAHQKPAPTPRTPEPTPTPPPPFPYQDDGGNEDDGDNGDGKKSGKAVKDDKTP